MFSGHTSNIKMSIYLDDSNRIISTSDDKIVRYVKLVVVAIRGGGVHSRQAPTWFGVVCRGPKTVSAHVQIRVGC